MKPGEKCIIPDCDEASFSGAKPIYINITVDGKRTWRKVGALCRVHLVLQGETGVWLPSAVNESRQIMSWLVRTPADDINFKSNLERASLPLLRRVLERLEDELRRGFQHKTRIKKVAARIRALEKEILRKDAEKRADDEQSERRGREIVDMVLPQKKTKDIELSVADWRHIHELGKEVLPGKEIMWAGRKVRCDSCGSDYVAWKDKAGNILCPACDAPFNEAGEP